MVSWDHGASCTVCKHDVCLEDTDHEVRTTFARAISRLFACTSLLTVFFCVLALGMLAFDDDDDFSHFFNVFPHPRCSEALMKAIYQRAVINLYNFNLDLQYQTASVASSIPFQILDPFIILYMLNPWCASFLSQFDEANCAHCIQCNISIHLLAEFKSAYANDVGVALSAHGALLVAGQVVPPRFTCSGRSCTKGESHDSHMHCVLACMRACICSILLHLWFGLTIPVASFPSLSDIQSKSTSTGH